MSRLLIGISVFVIGFGFVLFKFYEDLTCQAGSCMNPTQFFAALAQILFGASAAWIAYQQWVLSRNKSKFELYEKRYEAYKGLQSFLGSILRNGKIDTEDLIAFKWKFEEHFFLFGSDIHDYVKNIYEKSLEFRGYEHHLSGIGSLPVGPDRNKIVNKQDALLKWLIEQPSDCKKLFEKYLRIK